MTEHLPVLIPVVPLSAALLCMLFTRIHKRLGQVIVILALLFSAISAGMLLGQVLSAGEPIHYWMGDWMPPLGIEFVVDPINATIVLVISILAVAACLYSHSFVKDYYWVKHGGYYTLISLLSVGLFGMTLTGDVFNYYVFLEISSLTCYTLVAIGGDKGVVAAFRYLLIGTIGASFYLMGVGILYSQTGTLNMADLSNLIAPMLGQPLILLALVCIFASFAIKMALFPFHGWQPDAYTHSHPGAAPLITGAMSKVPAYAMLRFFFFIFGVHQAIIQNLTFIIGVCGAIAMVYGSYIAIKQTDLRRMLAYSSIAQLGYIAMGFGIGNEYGLAGATLHIVNHAFMKGGLFLCVGALSYRFGVTDLDHIGQLQKKMPWTTFTIVMAALSMVGIPPTGGFFSKYYLMIGAWERGQYAFIAILVVSTLLNAIYFLRVLERIFINKPIEYKEVNPSKGRLEVPLNMLIPIILFGVAIVVLGVLNATIVGDVLLDSLKEVAYIW